MPPNYDLDPIFEPLLRRQATYTAADQLKGRIRFGISPLISGNPWYGQTLSSTIPSQWYAGGVAIAGETGATYRVSSTLPIGTAITQAGSNSLTIVDPLDAFTWALRLQTQRGPETSGTFVATAAIVSQWVDQYGTSGRAVTAASGQEPTMQVSKGNRVLRFASSKMTLSPSVPITGDMVVVMAFRPTSTASAGRNIIEGSSAGSYLQLTSSINLRVKPNGGSAVDLALPRALQTTRWSILELVVSGNIATVYINGMAGGAAALSISSFTLQNIGEGMAADIGAFMVHAGSFTSAERIIIRKALSQYVSDRFFVSNAGSDANDGYTMDTAFATIGKAVGTGLYPGDKVTLRSGDTWREDVRPSSPWPVGNENIVFTTSGAGKATILGSNQIASAWTLVTGTEYSTPIAANPRNAFLITGTPVGEGSVTKLILGTAGSLTNGQYGYDAGTGTLRVNIGSDPTSQRIEVPRDGNSADSHVFYISGSHGYWVENLNLYFGFVDGFFANGKQTTITRCATNWNGEDGIGSGNSGQVDALFNDCVRNGGIRTVSGGRGDGISYHDTATGLIIGNRVIDNEKGGVLNLEGCNVTVARNYLENNNQHALILATADPSGTHLWYGNIIVFSAADSGIGISRDGNLNTAIIKAWGNTLYRANQTGTALSQVDEARNNIIYGFQIGCYNVTTADHNCIAGCLTPYSGTTPGTGSITSDPLFLDVAGRNFGIRRGSACYGSGVSLGVPNFDGVTSTTPNIGAK